MYVIRTWLLGIIFLGCYGVASAQEESKLKQAWRMLQERLDSSAIRKFDQRYIEVPKNPWRVVLRGKTDEFNMQVDSYIDEDWAAEMLGDGEIIGKGRIDWKLTFNPPMAQSVGFFAGYRGLGFSYSYYLRKKTGRAYSFSSTGARYGLNFRLRHFSTNNLYVDATGEEDGVRKYELHSPGKAPDPIWVRSVIIDGYYLFNGRRFSQAAAYNQSVIQKRSSGSLMLGAMYHQSSLDLATDKNAAFILLNGGWGKFSIRQFNIGLGYGYNWVPSRGWLMNVMLMPTISAYNRIKTHYYDCNYSLFANYVDDGHKALPDDHDKDDSWKDDTRVWETHTETKYGKVQLNVDARASITYTWDRYFVSVFGQLNHFDYGYSRTEVNLTDWYIRGALGIRL